jgi:hypothetical protein
MCAIRDRKSKGIVLNRGRRKATRYEGGVLKEWRTRIVGG